MTRFEEARRFLRSALPRRMLAASDCPQATCDRGRETASLLRPNAVVFLFGELGAGKTLFAKGLCDALGVDPDEVTSPTYVIIQEYAGRVPVHHIDLYRIDDAGAETDLGLEEIFEGPGTKIVEWAERLDLERFPCDVAVFFDTQGETGRAIEIIHRPAE